MAEVENKDYIHNIEDKLKNDEENENVKSETEDSTDTKESNREDYSETDNIEPATQQTDTQSSSTKETDIQVSDASNDSELLESIDTNTADIEENVNISNENEEAEKTTLKPSEEEKKTQSIKKSNKHTVKTSEKLDESGPIDKMLVQGHYRTHSKSTLPHILTEYGLKEKGHPVIKKEKQKKKKKTVGLLGDADDDERLRRKQLQQTYGETRQRDTYYMEYPDFLQQKVVQQRQKAQWDREEAVKLAALREEEERKKLRLVRRVERVELKHDDSFLRNLPKTDTARIIALQDKMKKDGKLKTQNDVDKFWDDIRKPDVFYQQFKVKKNDAGVTEPQVDQDNNTSSCQTGPEGAPATEMPQRSLTSLSHISEASRNKDSWAITQKYQASHGPKPPTSERKRKDSTQMAKDAAVDLEKRCPKLEMPPLACFSLRLGEKPPDPEEITKKLDLKSREKTRKKFQRKLNKMYQRAMTNTAAANRILAQHGDLMEILEGAALRDVLAVFDEPPYPILEHYYRDIADPSRALEIRPDDRLSGASRTQPSARQSSAASRKLSPISDAPKSRCSSRRMKKSPEMIEYPLPLPLSFGEVTSREKTMEAKCTSTLWTNYMHAGKSLYAQT